MNQQNTLQVWVNEKYVPYNQATVPIRSHTLHYGTGAFEGIRSYETPLGTAVFRLNDHVNRLFYSAESIGIQMPYTREDVAKAILDTLQVNRIGNGYIRPIVFVGDVLYHLNLAKNQRDNPGSVNLAIIVGPFNYFDVDMKVHVSRWRRIPPDCVPVEAKLTGPYVTSTLAATEAGEFYRVPEALQLDINGNVAEGPGENLFIVSGRKLKTPPRGFILPGLTRDAVIQLAKFRGIEVDDQHHFTIDEVMNTADEALFSGTAIEVYPIIGINRKPVGKGEMGEITALLQRDYAQLVRGQLMLPGAEEWVSFVPKTATLDEKVQASL